MKPPVTADPPISDPIRSPRRRGLSRCERGATSVEYIVVIGGVVLGAIVAYQRFGAELEDKIGCLGASLSGGGKCSSGAGGLGAAAPGAEPGVRAEELAAPAGAKNQAYPGPAFVAGPGQTSPVHPSDVAQGQLGDCYVMASLGAIATRNPQQIQRMITENRDGTYTVHFQPNDDVTVTSVFPTKDGKPLYAQTGTGNTETWPMIVEKAYAQKVGSYEKVGEGGKFSTMLTVLTGQPSTAYKNVNTTFAAMYQQWQRGSAMVGTTYPADQARSNPFYQDDRSPPLLADHGYYVTGMDPKTKTVTLQNPWGWEGKQVTMTWADYQSAFTHTMTNPIAPATIPASGQARSN